jgi:hypothetical protein
MPRQCHQKHVRSVINTHITTLIPLFDSAHWFLVEVKTDTRTFTFYDSYGNHGQRKWSLTLKARLAHHIHRPWTAAQGIATQQPGTTECGTHTLLHILKHIPGAPSPDTSTIQWNHHMRIHHQHNHSLRPHHRYQHHLQRLTRRRTRTVEQETPVHKPRPAKI